MCCIKEMVGVLSGTCCRIVCGSQVDGFRRKRAAVVLHSSVAFQVEGTEEMKGLLIWNEMKSKQHGHEPSRRGDMRADPGMVALSLACTAESQGGL